MEAEKKKKNIDKKLIDISQKTFISVLILLAVLMAASIVLTYVVPKGEYGTKLNEAGEEITDYRNYVTLPDESGIPIWKGILAPFLLLGADGGINVIMLSIFLLVITGTFQAMNDNSGVKVIVGRIISRFKGRKFLLLSVIALVFMLFGSLLGLFEEMLTLLPIIVILTVSIGYDSFTGFIVSIVACGFGFASAITNPFTVLFASQIIGVNPMTKVWYRIIIFLVMYGFIELVLWLYTKMISKDPSKSYTYDRDQKFKDIVSDGEDVKNEKKIMATYLTFFAVVMTVLIVFSSLDAVRDYTVPALIAVFLIGGILASLVSTDFNFASTFKSFFKGALSVLPTIAFILMAASVKYILVEGKVLPTITNTINGVVEGRTPYSLALILFAIVLVLEFFISSSTAKAIFVMSVLSVLTLGLTKEMQVLIYTFADGYTNLLFPTSPVLLIGLSMIEFSYFKWLKKSWPFFIITFALVVAFLMLGVLIKF
ncbi:MAG: hypothetical protein J5832_02625 [Clostridia bacterium]|nr:hypothetical protein [Clostridia bacterium]